MFFNTKVISETKPGYDPRFKTMIEGPPAVKRLCGQCHAFQVNGQCFAGDCVNGEKVRTSQGRDWILMAGWMRKILHCSMTDEEAKVIADYLNLVAPRPKFSAEWNEVASFSGGFNVPSMKTYANALYAGLEGNPSIYRTEDGSNWKSVMTAPGMSDIFSLEEFKGTLYAGTEGREAEIWRSKDGVHWEKTHTFPHEEMPYARDTGVTALGVFKGYLYAGTYHLRVYRTANGIDWEEVGLFRLTESSSSSIKIRFLREFNGYLYAGSTYTGKLYRSFDGTRWNELNTLERQGVKGFMRALVFNDYLYLGTTGEGIIWKTRDGERWKKVFDLEEQTGKTGGMIGSLSVYHEMLYAGATVSFANAGVYRSREGEHWEAAGSFSPFDAEAMAVFQQKLYVATIYPGTPKVFRMIEK
ncbi:MAG: WD40/YVTN/BNR-like repeat-containing protein [Nitrospiria bacterium]